jgi:hypothetical protein
MKSRKEINKKRKFSARKDRRLGKKYRHIEIFNLEKKSSKLLKKSSLLRNT